MLYFRKYHITKDLLHRFIGFLFISGVAVIIDSSIFYLLRKLDFCVFLGNFISSFTAVLFIYISTRYVFEKGKHSALKCIIFFLYYGVSIMFFSYIIAIIHKNFHYNALIIKFLTLPFSFITNYTCVSLIEVKIK